jgi:hypothetical protein
MPVLAAALRALMVRMVAVAVARLEAAWVLRGMVATVRSGIRPMDRAVVAAAVR